MASHPERAAAIAQHPRDFQAWAREVAGRTEAALAELMPVRESNSICLLLTSLPSDLNTSFIDTKNF